MFVETMGWVSVINACDVNLGRGRICLVEDEQTLTLLKVSRGIEGGRSLVLSREDSGLLYLDRQRNPEEMIEAIEMIADRIGWDRIQTFINDTHIGRLATVA